MALPFKKRHFLEEDGASSSQRPVKSRAVVKEESGYVEGSILRIKLVSFLTYDAVEFSVGPYLNIIIGPNGTGKSAIVCAICLGLAGKTTWLGRASDSKDFIKYGSERAKIEIELFNPYDDNNYIICREIFKTKASVWFINGKIVSQKAVEECVTGLNIQVGNLCQFLPQEKVADFARMSQQELLENTEKAISQDKLYKSHQKLKDARQRARGYEQDVEKYRQQLDLERQKNARLEEDVRNYHDRKNFLQKVEILKLKKPWLEYQYLKDSFERGKTERDQKIEELNKAKKDILPLEKKCHELKIEIDGLKRESSDLSQLIRSKAKDVSDQRQAMNVISEKIAEGKCDFDAKLKEEEMRKQKLHDLQDQLKFLETSLSHMDESSAQNVAKNLEKVTEEMRQVSANITAVQAEGETIRREVHSLKLEKQDKEQQLKGILDISNRRLETLRNLNRDTYEAVVWLRANKSLFKQTIHEPMIISLNVNKKEDAKLVESLISFNDLKSFVCEDPDDLTLFIKHMSENLKLRINSVKAPSQPVSSFQPAHPIDHYRNYGFERYMQSLFTCPDPIMSYLCLMYHVHKIPVGSAAVKNNQQQIIKECPELTRFYSPDVQLSVRKSKYSNNVSMTNSALRPPKALVDSMNVEREHELRNKLKEVLSILKSKEDNYKLLQKQSEDLELKINSLREEKRNLLKQRDERKNIESQITTKNQRIQQLIKEELDVKVEEKKLGQLMNSLVRERLKCLEKLTKLSRECLNLAKDRSTKMLKLSMSDVNYTRVETELRNENQRFENLETEVQELKNQTQELKQQAREKLTEAKKIASIGQNENLEEALTARGVWEDFKKAPSAIDELDGEIHSMQARAESMFQVDERVVKDFEKREKEIKKIEELLAETEGRQQTHQNEITESKKNWLDPLQQLIEQINAKFSYFLTSLQCCGEISLSVPENLEDYEKYGICIKVKFRDEETLRALTAHHQSGGERSVSTVLYMLALQELTKCPFRCVDEINQGMDPKNERKIFTLVVQTVCKESRSQYFLLTPKLLPELIYDSRVSTLCVYNGPELPDYKQWSVTDFLRRRANLAQ